MGGQLDWRLGLELGAAALTGALALLTLVWHDWIEAFGVDPDHGSGAAEWAVVVVCASISVGLGLRVRARLRAA